MPVNVIPMNAPASPQEIERRRAMAQALMSPSRKQEVRHPLIAAANFAHDAAGTFQNWRADRMEKQRRDALISTLSGGQAPQGVDPGVWGGFVQANPEEAMGALLQGQMSQSQAEAERQAAWEMWQRQQDYLRANPEPAKPTDDMREYEAAVQQGYGGTIQDWIMDTKRAGASQTNIDMKGAGAWETESAKLFAKRYDEMTTQAAKAQEMLGLYDIAAQALDSGLRTGAMGSGEQALRQFGVYLGIGDADKVAGGELLSAVTNRMALMMRNPDSGMGMPGAVSDRDLTFLKEAQIGLDRSPEGNRQMLEAFRKIEQRKIEIAQLADQYIMEHGRMDPSFNQYVREYAKANPLFPEPTGQATPPQSEIDIPPGAIDMLRGDPSLAPAFDEKYGPGASQRILGGQ